MLKLVCMDNSNFEDELTIGEKYLGWYESPDLSNWVVIRNTDETKDKPRTFFTNRFVVIDEKENSYDNGAENIKGSALDKQAGGQHYKHLPIQPIEYCQKNGLGYCESNVVKYVTRHKDKNGKEDIEKAIHMLELLLELEYNDS